MTKINIGFWATVRRECRRMCSRNVYLFMMVIIPIGCALFFLSLMDSGLPVQTPVAVVDYDHSQMSRQLIRSINATQLTDITEEAESYEAAMQRVRQGAIYGFVVIPADFQKDAIAGLHPTLELYSNMTYFVPGTLAFKGFKTVAVTTSGGIMRSQLSYVGLTDGQISPMLQPVKIDTKGIGNPWLNYSYYLSPSFVYALLSLLIMLTTTYSITEEIKAGTSPQWLKTAKGHITVAVAGKLLPQTIISIIVTLCVASMMLGYEHFPQNGSLGSIIIALVLFVVASQAFALLISSVLPNPRLAFSVTCLLNVLSFSFAGFSFPVEQMYGAIAVFSYIVPVRYLFLIYVNTALNGFDVYYVRYFYVALLVIIAVGPLGLKRLRSACINPVYVP